MTCYCFWSTPVYSFLQQVDLLVGCLGPPHPRSEQRNCLVSVFYPSFCILNHLTHLTYFISLIILNLFITCIRFIEILILKSQEIQSNEWLSFLQMILRTSGKTYRITIAFHVAASNIISSCLRSRRGCGFFVSLGINLETRVDKCSISYLLIHFMIVGTHAFKLLIDCSDSCLAIFIGQSKTCGDGFGVEFLILVFVDVESIIHLMRC